MLNASHTYQERQSAPNLGEQIFEDYCKKMGYQCVKVGFDEKRDVVKNISSLNPYLRNLPDYLVDTGSMLMAVQVKGTVNMKKKEIDMIPLFMEWYSSPKAPLVYAFCFHDREKPVLVYPDKVIELYQKATDRKWDDGVVYRNIGI